ncbi:MAG: pyridoxamine 5'-phosphate oxidase family protein [Bacteroidales bacterium]
MQIDKNQVIDLIRFSKYCNLSVINEDGYPRIIMMALIRYDNMEHIWLVTSKSSQKYIQLQKQPRVGLLFSQNTNYVTLIGEIDILEDQKTKNDLWTPALEKYFPLGMTDPDYIVLKFRTELITAGINFSSFFEEIEDFIPGN